MWISVTAASDKQTPQCPTQRRLAGSCQAAIAIKSRQRRLGVYQRLQVLYARHALRVSLLDFYFIPAVKVGVPQRGRNTFRNLVVKNRISEGRMLSKCFGVHMLSLFLNGPQKQFYSALVARRHGEKSFVSLHLLKFWLYLVSSLASLFMHYSGQSSTALINIKLTMR